LIQNKADLEDIIRDLQHKVSHLTNEKITRDSVSSKTESKEIESETATKIRESLNQYREELNKR
jgi:Fic family protein